jgi:hypothetical protein
MMPRFYEPGTLKVSGAALLAKVLGQESAVGILEHGIVKRRMKAG